MPRAWSRPCRCAPIPLARSGRHCRSTATSLCSPPPDSTANRLTRPISRRARPSFCSDGRHGVLSRSRSRRASIRRPTPSSWASIAPARPIARNARLKGFAASLIFSIARTCSRLIGCGSKRIGPRRRCCSSNGNLEAAGEADRPGRHFAVWRDPHKKPCYLFALVAGDLGHITDSFVTASGRNVALGIYVEHGREERAPLRDGRAASGR